MEPEELLEKLRPLLVDRLMVNEYEVIPDARLVEDLGADSLDVVDLIEAVQAEFDIEIKDGDIEGIKTIGDVISCIDDLLKLKEIK